MSNKNYSLDFLIIFKKSSTIEINSIRQLYTVGLIINKTRSFMQFKNNVAH